MSQSQAPAAASAKPGAEKRANARKLRIGRVSSTKMQKTIVVEITKRTPHPLYGKIRTTTSKLYAHDDKGEAKEGDLVEIQETRPLSKLKRWRFVRIVQKASK